LASSEGIDPEAAYYQAVEEFFVSRRGDPLFLSNADWLLIRKWRQAGTPLRVVLRGIEDALDSHAHSWGRDRKVGSLAYCATEVEVARERWERALNVDTEDGVDASSALTGFAAALEGAHELGPAARAVAARASEQLRRRAAEPGALRDLESWLSAHEAELLECLRQEAGPGVLSSLEAAVEADLAPYRERMPARVLRQIRADAVARRLLDARGLPRLSLFHL
jgi:hypothetical protein